MTPETALDIVETHLKQKLNNVQALVFRQSWEGKTYKEIADNSCYDADYIKYVGFGLWQLLSQLLGEKITKSNIYTILQYTTPSIPILTASDNIPDTARMPIEALSIKSNFIEANNHPAAYNYHLGWADAVDVPVLYGRENELSTLKQWILQQHCRLVALFGMGGIGKTSLAVSCVQQIQDQFDHVIWRSLRNAPPIEDILTDLLQLLSGQQSTTAPQTLDVKISQLMHYFRQHRCLLVLDNAEVILQSRDCSGRYCDGYEGYGQLLRSIAETRHQSCLLFTSREKPIGLAFKEGWQKAVQSLQLRSLQAAAINILQYQGLSGSQDDMEALINMYLGNPLALKIVGTTIQNLFDSNIAEFLAEDIAIFGEIKHLLNQQFSRLSDIEKQIMFCLASVAVPISISELQTKLGGLTLKATLLEGLVSLECRGIILKNAGRFSLPQLFLEYINITKQSTKQCYAKFPREIAAI